MELISNEREFVVHLLLHKRGLVQMSDLVDYCKADATQLAELLRTGQMTASGVFEIACASVTAVNQELNALAFPLLEKPLGYDRSGPLAGVPFLVKDEGPHAAGLPWSSGSRYFDGSVAESNSEQITRARAAGLAVIGSTATPELCMNFATESRRNGITRNPWDLDRTPGGSSGGAAALVAAGAVPLAHGTDGLGSIRIPASFTGILGLKPSRGRTPCEVDGFSGAGYDFVLARSVRDTALLLDLLSGPALESKYRVPPFAGTYAEVIKATPQQLRIGLATTASTDDRVAPECAAAARAAARCLEQLGHVVEEVDLKVDRAPIVSAFTSICALAYLASFQDSKQPDEDTVEGMTLAGWQQASRMSAVRLARGLTDFDLIVRHLAHVLDSVDLLITPTSPVLAVPHGTMNYDSSGYTIESWIEKMLTVGAFTAPFNIGGQPAVSLPLAQSESGLPIGVQLVAASGRDDLVLQVAAQLEKAMPWSARQPPVFAAG